MFKNNIDKKIVKYGIKKLSLGIVSVAIGTLVFLGGSASAHDENSLNENGNTVHEKSKKLEITSETTNNLENKTAKESNNISNDNMKFSVSENNIETCPSPIQSHDKDNQPSYCNYLIKNDCLINVCHISTQHSQIATIINFLLMKKFFYINNLYGINFSFYLM